MTAILIILLVVIFISIAIPITTALLIKHLMVPNAKPLTEEELKLCEIIVKENKGYPYVCKWALKNKKCPCLPCKKLDDRKNQG